MIAIAGVTGAVAVLVSSSGSTAQRAAHAPAGRPGEPSKPRPRPQLTRASDVRTTALHRAHLAAADRVECASCHDLRAREFRAPPDEKCLGCHTGHEPAVHDGAPEAGCLTCHDFLLPEGATAWAHGCETCHDRARGTRPAIVIHAKQDCVACHAVHPRRDVRPAACLGCHDTRTTGHPAGGSGRAVCQACHAPHRPAHEARARCEACHVAGGRDLPAAARIPSTALFRGHDRCLQCHTGHTFTRAAVKACRDCHPGKRVLASERVAAHASCTSCHEPHAAQASPAARCPACHAAIAADSKHPRDPGGRDCVGCHPPHQDLGPSRVVLGCTDRCHADKREAGHGTATCGDCHARHRFLPTRTGPALCLGCHAGPIGHAPAIAASEGHARCTSCHLTAAHRPAAARPACGTCHQVEASTAPAGHAECRNCHDVHSGKLRVEAARCESCHADRTHTRHLRVPGGCQACHRPHGPRGPATRPPCSQCHAPASLTGLHASSSHKSCTACHLAHAPEVTGREPCLRCHADRRDHEPAARLCQACHPFGGQPR
ncbi:MAG TPA: hypothetical protein VFT22_40725 [Kofleriaceae bacterium]|nr:hypothetical protein [Kofleriaceae bacterium]